MMISKHHHLVNTHRLGWPYQSLKQIQAFVDKWVTAVHGGWDPRDRNSQLLHQDQEC